MSIESAIPTLAPESLRCRDVMPTVRCISSRDVGWRSLLIDVHSGVSSQDPYTPVRTPDPRAGVTLSGRYAAECYFHGRWRHDSHAPGSITLHRTDEVARVRYPKPRDADYQAALIYFPLAQLAAAADHYRRIGQRSEIPTFNRVIGRDPALTQMAHTLVEAMALGADDLYGETVAAWLAVHVVTRHGPGANVEDNRSVGTLTDARLARVIEYMSSHFSESLTLEQLAAEACISKYHFARLFREKVGRSPHRYLMEIRLETARRMLVSSDASIAQVASACGYPTATHFSTAFTRRFGISPTAFRVERTSLQSTVLRR